MVAVEVTSLGRTFRTSAGSVTALAEVDMTVAPGEIVGLLGANGAGKTTLTKILATLLLPTSGSARLCGHDVVRDARAVRETVGVVFGGDRGLYGRLSGKDNLRFFATLRGVRPRTLRTRMDVVLDEVGLTEAADRPVETYSKGMRQRLHIAIGTIRSPRVLLLDEPTVGLDPVEAERLRGHIAELRADGVAILLTSHYLLDVERLADRVAILSGGRMVADMTVAEFVRTADFAARVTVRGRGQPPKALSTPEAGVALASSGVHGEIWEANLRIRDWRPESLSQLSSMLNADGILDVSVTPPRLEDVYQEFTQARIRNEGPLL